MSEDTARLVIKEIINEVIEKEKLKITGAEKKAQVKSSVVEKIFNPDTYIQGSEGDSSEIIDKIICHLIDAVVMTFNISFGKNWIIKIFTKMF